jgi:predicted transcriptional regulator
VNQAKVALQAMHPDVWYTAEDLASFANMNLSTAKQVLPMLEKGGLVEANGPKYKRHKKYKTKQKRLF